jgi:L-asparagine transporter-like permease
MDLREEDQRFHEGKQLVSFATVLKILAVLLLMGWIAVVLDRSSFREIVDLFGALAVAGIMWAVALIVVSQARVEKNTREAAKTLERIAETMQPRKPEGA